MLTLASWQVNLMAISFATICIFMLLVILIQKPKGGGLSGAFGGAGSAQAAFGAKTGDVLTWFTVLCFIVFLSLAMGLTWAIKPRVVSNPDQTVETQTEQTTDTSTDTQTDSIIPQDAPEQDTLSTQPPNLDTPLPTETNP